QGAIVRYSALGSILAQHVSIQDLQPSIDRRFRKMQELRHEIAVLEAQGTSEARAQASMLRGRLVELRKEQAQTIQRAGLAPVAVTLRTKAAAVVPPSRPGRIERALDHSGTILLKELAVLLYIVIVAAPIALLAAGGYFGARALRRRSYERLLEQ